MTVAADALPDDPGTLKAMLIGERVQNERLLQIIKELLRHRFGRRPAVRQHARRAHHAEGLCRIYNDAG
jgi:hypothetical protein